MPFVERPGPCVAAGRMARNFQSTVPPWLTVTTTWPGTYTLPVVSCCVYGMPQIVSCAIAVSAALSVKRTTVRLTRLTPTISCRPRFSDGQQGRLRSSAPRVPESPSASTRGGIGGYGRTRSSRSCGPRSGSFDSNRTASLNLSRVGGGCSPLSTTSGLRRPSTSALTTKRLVLLVVVDRRPVDDRLCRRESTASLSLLLLHGLDREQSMPRTAKALLNRRVVEHALRNLRELLRPGVWSVPPSTSAGSSPGATGAFARWTRGFVFAFGAVLGLGTMPPCRASGQSPQQTSRPSLTSEQRLEKSCPTHVATLSSARRGGRAVECGGLENR